MDGQDLSIFFEGEEPEERAHFVLGFHDHAWARDERYIMFSRYDGSQAKLYDLREDPGMTNDISGEHTDVVTKMFGDYVLKDAGGPLPTYGF
jgi:hypothetical protein